MDKVKNDKDLPVPGERKKPKFRNKADRKAYEEREKAAEEYQEDRKKYAKGGVVRGYGKATRGRKFIGIR